MRPLVEGPGPVTLVAVHAHPDDETLATGVALAHHVRRGDDVHVVTCTLGEEGEVIPPELAHLEGSEALAPHRRGELARAVAALGVQHHYLGGDVPRWRDSGMAGSPAASHPRAFAAAPLEEAAQELTALLGRIGPDVVLTYDHHGGYGHPDHVRTHEVTVAAVAAMPPERRPVLYQVLVPRSWAEQDRDWLARHVPADAPVAVPSPRDPYPPSVVPDESVTHAVRDPEAAMVRTAALREHRTQVTVHDGFYALSNDIAARLVDREGYAVIEPGAGR